jgi:hypothetical protein
MKANDAILVALLVVLVIIVAFHGGSWMKGDHGCDGFAGGSCGADANPHQQYTGSTHNPYTVLNQQLSEIRGFRHDGYNQPPFWRHPHGLDRYHRAGAHLKPEDISKAERSQWFSATGPETHVLSAPACASAEHFNTEVAHDAASDSMQYHQPGPAIDYGEYVTDLVTDPRTRDNHRRWVEEMKPWSGTAMKVDTLDMENYVDFIGLRRPQAVVQYNPLQLTEIDTYDLAVNPKFNFKG